MEKALEVKCECSIYANEPSRWCDKHRPLRTTDSPFVLIHERPLPYWLSGLDIRKWPRW